MSANHNNMIRVNGTKIKTPSSFSWGLQDISASDAGRTQDSLMHKNRLSKKRKISLSWNNLTPEETHTILLAFDDEYFRVRYYDPLDGDDVTREFYRGDMTAPIKIWTTNNKRYETLSFDIIER